MKELLFEEAKSQPEKKVPAEQILEIPEHLRGISDEAATEKARRIWPAVMAVLREEVKRERPAQFWGSFPLPRRGQPGRNIELTFLSTTGCRHATGKEKGCTVCDYGMQEKVTEEELMSAAEKALDALEKSNAGQHPAVFNITPSGSFFDDKELPATVRRYVLERIRAYKDKYPETEVEFETETRLEYVTEEKLSQMRAILGHDIKVEIGYGMESTNPLVREGIINKKLPEDYREKIALLKEYGVFVAGHVITKAPFLTELEAIEDSVATVNDLFNNKLADMAIDMTMNSRPGTLVRALQRDGLYELPKIWSTIEIMRRLGAQRSKETRFFGFSVSGNDLETVKGCSECAPKIMPLLQKFSGDAEEYRQIMAAAETIDCDCKKEWRERMATQPASTLAERVAAGAEYLAEKYLNK